MYAAMLEHGNEGNVLDNNICLLINCFAVKLNYTIVPML